MSLKISLTPIEHMIRDKSCYAVAFSHDGKYLAAAFGNGYVAVFDVESGLKEIGKAACDKEELPSTNVAWRPGFVDGETGLYQFAVASSTSGLCIFTCDVTEPKDPYVNKTHSFKEETSETACLHYSLDGNTIVTGGSDRMIRTYDVSEKPKLTASLDKGVDDGGHSRTAHTNRIFATKFVDDSTVVSGGWDAPVQVWDLKVGKSVRQMTGPQVGTDGIEPIPKSSTILIASGKGNQLQAFDINTGRENTQLTEKLSAELGKANVGTIRADSQVGIWVLCANPYEIRYLDQTEGTTKARTEVAAPFLSAATSQHLPGMCAVGATNGLFLAKIE